MTGPAFESHKPSKLNMANIVVFGAAGKAGRLITGEASRRGHHVTAVTRSSASPAKLSRGVVPALGDPTSPASVEALATGADALVVAVGGSDVSVWLRAAHTLVETLRKLPGKSPRIIHMGGGASLLTPEGGRILDAPGFPEAFRASAAGQADALAYYRQAESPVTWTYVSPPPVHFAPGRRTGHYRTGSDHPVVDADGKSSLSYEDFAVAVVDEIERGQFQNARFTVGY
jgi:putative NADH-flavin reductase